MQREEAIVPVRVEELPLSALRSSRYYTRIGVFDAKEELENLAKSIQELGLLELPRVRPLGRGEYEIISGHRRITAISEYLALDRVKCEVYTDLQERAVFKLQTAENLQRSNLTPYEEGKTYLVCAAKFRLDSSQIAEFLDRSVDVVKKRMAFARKVDDYQRVSGHNSLAFIRNVRAKHLQLLDRLRSVEEKMRGVGLVSSGAPVEELEAFVLSRESDYEKKRRPSADEIEDEEAERRQHDVAELSARITDWIGDLKKSAPKEMHETIEKLGESVEMLTRLVDESKTYSEKTFVCLKCNEKYTIKREIDVQSRLEQFIIVPRTSKDLKGKWIPIGYPL